MKYDLTDYCGAESSDSAAAAREAAEDVCRYYEIPKDTEPQASSRGERAVEIYDVLKGA